MNRAIAGLVSALLAPLMAAACAVPLAPPNVRWEGRDTQATASVSDVGDCRAQARRQADMRYPPRVLEVPVRNRGLTSVTLPSDDAGLLPAENWFYAQCMRQKGYQLVSAPS